LTATRSGTDPLAIYTAGNVEGIRLAAQVMGASELLRKGAAGISQEERAAAVAVKMFGAAELGLPPVLTGCTTLHVIYGRLTMEAKLKRQLALKSGLVEVVEWTPPQEDDPEATCTLHLRRRDGSGFEHKTTWTVSRAAKKGLNKDKNGNVVFDGVWAKWPERMTAAKCWGECVDLVCPDACGGLPSVDDFGFDDENARFAPEEDPTKPIGMEWADEFRRKLATVPNRENVLSMLGTEKLARYGSSDYKLQAIPVGDKEHWEEWFSGRRAEAGKRIGPSAADELWQRVKKVSTAAGIAEHELVAEVQGWIAERGKTTAADLNEADARQIAEWLAARLPGDEAAATTDVIEGEFSDVEPDPEAWTPTPLGGAGSASRLSPDKDLFAAEEPA
jgi:hypothetical protein